MLTLIREVFIKKMKVWKMSKGKGGGVRGNIRTMYRGLDRWKIVQSLLFNDQECQNNESFIKVTPLI